MAKINNNVLLREVSGMFGNQIVYRKVRGKMIMCNRPTKRNVLTPHQEIAKSRFQDAVRYAKAHIAVPATKAEYTTGITDKLTSAFTVALTDCLKAPEIKLIDVTAYKGVIGNKIAIKAVDDFKVVSVTVEIKTSAGVVIESGVAVLEPGQTILYAYTVTKANAAFAGSKVTVTAKDKPGNNTILEKVV
jgi:hypothetical protein